MYLWRTVAVAALLMLGNPASAGPRDVRSTAPERAPSADATSPENTLAERPPLGIAELRAAIQESDTAPLWAERAHQQLLQRIERLQTMQERLAARIETPVPRLHEPMILLTVGSAALVLGFVAGRTVQRRSTRRDRFRL